jgi:branched-chain amino acid transport system substrate-binding protein
MRNPFRPRLAAAAVAGCCALSLGLAAPQRVSAAADVIRLGVAGPQSGDLASYGIPSARAAELVVREFNAKGGVLGRQVKLLVEDDVCKPEIAANTAGRLVSAKADVVLGHICSGAAKAALGIYRDAGVIAMSPSATNPELTQSGQYPNFYRTIAPDDAQARLEVDFALDTLKVRKIAVLHDKQDYGRGLAEFAKKFIDASGGKGQVVLFEGITPGAVDYSAVIQKVRQSGAEAVIYGGYHPEASKLVSGMRKKKIDLPFISDDGVKDDTFIKVAGAFAEGVYASGPRDTSTNPLAVAAVAAHRTAYGGDPGAFYINAWAATQALLNAIAKAGTTDSAAVARALHTEFVETPLGRIRFDARGDAEGVGFAMYRVRKGAYVEVK